MAKDIVEHCADVFRQEFIGDVEQCEVYSIPVESWEHLESAVREMAHKLKLDGVPTYDLRPLPLIVPGAETYPIGPLRLIEQYSLKSDKLEKRLEVLVKRSTAK